MKKMTHLLDDITFNECGKYTIFANFFPPPVTGRGEFSEQGRIDFFVPEIGYITDSTIYRTPLFLSFIS